MGSLWDLDGDIMGISWKFWKKLLGIYVDPWECFLGFLW
jgi:hypothetical protein